MNAGTYTPDQLGAINAQGSVSVRAGAGSGKTRVLTARYLRALGNGVDPSAIAAVTFTDKAAAEMRDRIRRGLDELDLAVDRRVRLCEALIDAPIKTIPGLCTSILREFPIEAGVDPAFEIADESRALQLSRAAIDATIGAAVEDPTHPARPSLELLLSHYTRAQVTGLVDAVMRTRRYLSDEAAATVSLSPPEMLATWRDLIRREAAAVLHGLAQDKAVTHLLDALRACAPACTNPDDKLLGVIRAALDAFATINAHDAFDVSPVIAALSSAYLTKDGKPCSYGRTGAKGAWAGSDIADVREDVGRFAQCLTRLAPFRAIAMDRLDVSVARLVHALWRLVGEADLACSALKGQGAVLDFDDLEARTIALLKSASGRAVLDTLRARYRLLLVDESQDLNLLQYRLIDLLGGGASTECFIVGDPQQSIYGFRNTDVRLLDRLERDFLPHDSERVRLAANFRSGAPLLAFANRLFAPLLTGGEAFDVAYEPMAARRADEAHTHIELAFAARPDDLTGEHAGFDPAAACVAQRIARLVGGGCAVAESAANGARRVRPARYGDVAVLLRTRGILSELRTALRALGIPHLVYKGTGFYQSQEVRDVYIALRFLADPSYDLGLAAMLRSPLFALSDDGLFLLAHERGNDTLLAVLRRSHSVDGLSSEDRAVLERAHQSIPQWIELVNRVRPSVLLQRVLDDTGAWCTYAPTGADANLRKLVRVIRAAQRPSASVGEIVDLLHEHIHRRPGEGTEPESSLDENAVKIMTIHAAKGLEFPVVFVLGLEDNLRRRPASQPVQIDPDLGVALAVPKALQEGARRGAMYDLIADRRLRKELAEQKRLLYVACTRAQDHLFLVSAVGAQKPGESWRQWITDALRLDGQIPDEDGTADLALAAGLTLRVTRETHAPLAPAAPPPGKAHRPRDASGAPTLDLDELAALLAPVELEAPIELFTVSQFRDFERCPRLYHARYVAGIAFDPPLLASHDETGDTVEETSGADAQRILGLVLHALLQQHGKPAALSLDEAAQRAARGETLDDALAAGVAARAADIMQGFLGSDVARQVLDATAWPELPFALRINGAVIRGRIDRLIGGSPPLVVDFKTPAAPAAATAATLDAAYGQQLRIYARAASRLLGADAVRTMLVLPETAQSFEWRYGPAGLKEISVDIARRLDEIRSFDLARRLETVSACGRCAACRTLGA